MNHVPEQHQAKRIEGKEVKTRQAYPENLPGVHRENRPEEEQPAGNVHCKITVEYRDFVTASRELKPTQSYQRKDKGKFSMEDSTPEVQSFRNKDQIPQGALGSAELEDAAQQAGSRAFLWPLHSRSHLNCHGAPSKAAQHPWRQLQTH